MHSNPNVAPPGYDTLSRKLPAPAEKRPEFPSGGRWKTCLHQIRRDSQVGWTSIRQFLNRHRWKLLATLALLIAAVALYTFPRDSAWLKVIRGSGDPEIRHLAQQIGWWGKLAQYNLLVVAGLWVAGTIRKSRYLQRLAVVTFLSTVLAGVSCNIFRFTLGRPRPWTGVDPAEFQGIQPQARYHGFPSGHTSTAFGTAIPVLVALPQVGAPITLFAVTMGWARMYDRQHYPSDVLVGAAIGTIFGLAGGLPLRRSRSRGLRLKNGAKPG